MTLEELKHKNWFSYVEEDVSELLLQSFKLLETSQKWPNEFHDYSFIVFPAAKAYEGFLKKVFFDLGFITKEDYYGKRFRIGKALNPDLDRDLRARESVYDKLVKYCNGKELADQLWDTWKSCRNSVFHWFPEEKTAINRDEAEVRIKQIVSAIDEAFIGCKLSPKP